VGKVFDAIGREARRWIGAQRMFFVATARSSRRAAT
jgi:hypothetical protein